MRNVHKIDGSKIKLPTELQEEDRGYKSCGTPFLALADVSDTVQWKNDVFGVAMIADSITVQLEDHAGALVNAIGYSVTFPFQDDATGFVIDWRSNLIAYGAGCYRVKVSFDINGFTGDFYKGTFELMPYSVTASEKNVRLLVNYNDLVKQDGINYRDSGFYTSIRVHGYFGDEQVNSEHNNILKSNDVREKVRNFSAPIYTFRTRPVNRCFTRPIKHILLNASNFWISDYNAWSHESYKDFNVILNEESSIEMEGEETFVRSIIAEFKDKNWSTESKFSGNNAEPPNLSELIENALPKTIGLFIHVEETDNEAEITITSQTSGTYQSVDNGGLTNFVILKNNVASSLPITLVPTDVLKFTFDGATENTVIIINGIK